MSRYKITDQHGINFVTLTVVDWVDAYIRKQGRLCTGDWHLKKSGDLKTECVFRVGDPHKRRTRRRGWARGKEAAIQRYFAAAAANFAQWMINLRLIGSSLSEFYSKMDLEGLDLEI